MKTIRINLDKIDEASIYHGKNGRLVDIVMFDNRDGEDQYGNLGFVTQDIGKDRRIAGERGPILGNWKEIGACSAPPPREIQENSARMERVAVATEGDDDIPF